MLVRPAAASLRADPRTRLAAFELGGGEVVSAVSGCSPEVRVWAHSRGRMQASSSAGQLLCPAIAESIAPHTWPADRRVGLFL